VGVRSVLLVSFSLLFGLSLAGCPRVECGNGKLEEGEECDDGNNFDGDGCQANCLLPACGDGVQDPGELCFVAKNFPAAAGSNFTPLVLGDFNGDGQLDLAVGNVGTDEVEILLNLGGESFSAPVGFPLSGSFPAALATADFNQDGRPDLFSANFGTNEVELLLGQGGGQFVPGGTFPVGTGPITLVVGDFDSIDGPDLVVANRESSNLSILLNDGAGGFFESSSSPLATEGKPVALAVEEFGGGAFLDIVVANQNNGPVNFFFGQNNGDFQDLPLLITDAFGPTGVAVGDVDQNGIPDVLVTRVDVVGQEKSLDLFLRGQNQFFIPGESIFVSDIVTNRLHPVLADINQDGFLDIVVLAESGFVLILLGEGIGQFASPLVFEIEGTADSLAVDDLNGDGLLDIAVPIGAGNRVFVLFSAP
jgi:cysteine-rich repeat protein